MRTVFALTVLAAAAAAAEPLAAQEKGGEESVKVEVQKGDKDAAKDPAAVEKAVTTAHSVQVGGRSIAYKATAGTLTIRDDKGKPDASVFYVAYTADGDGGAKRPVKTGNSTWNTLTSVMVDCTRPEMTTFLVVSAFWSFSMSLLWAGGAP